MDRYVMKVNGEKISANYANAIFSSMYGTNIPKDEINDKVTEYKEYNKDGSPKYKFLVEESELGTIISGEFPVKVLDKLNEYNLIFKRVD